VRTLLNLDEKYDEFEHVRLLQPFQTGPIYKLLKCLISEKRTIAIFTLKK
jgi:hypothetical protein